MSRIKCEVEITTGYPNKTIIENLSVAIPEGKITSSDWPERQW